jgi:hypothetical protein
VDGLGAQPKTILRALAEIRATRLALASIERRLVASARGSCVAWREIGEALGVSTQSAHRRFRSLDPTSRPRVVDPVKAELDELYGNLLAGLSADAEGSDPSARAEVPGP